MKFKITEARKKMIRSLYEQLKNDAFTNTTTTAETMNNNSEVTTSSTETSFDENCVNIGYLINLSKSGGSQKSPEEILSLRNARIYFENLRDGVKPIGLTPGDRFVVNYSIKQTKNLPDEEKLQLEKLGRGIKST